MIDELKEKFFSYERAASSKKGKSRINFIVSIHVKYTFRQMGFGLPGIVF
jgi:hypothetical protein